LTVNPGLGYNRSIRFPVPARSNGEPEPPARRRREPRDFEPRATPARRPRRRRSQAPWLQRNALSVAAVSILLALLGLGFGLLQLMTRPEPASPALLAMIEPTVAATAGTTMNAAAIGPSVQLPAALSATSALVTPTREIQFNAKVLDANYTVEAGDTLGRIAVRFSTTVERIQALNNLADPRALRIGTKLVIPPPF
jgi:LysM repeat protein